MSFDDIPEDEVETFPCPQCPGDVTLSRQGIWECDSCDFAKAPTSEKGDRMDSEKSSEPTEYEVWGGSKTCVHGTQPPQRCAKGCAALTPEGEK